MTRYFYNTGTPEEEEVHATILPLLVNMFGKENMVMAEVGVWDGNSLKLYIDRLKQLNGKVYLIDWWKGSTQVESGLNMEYKEDAYENVYQQVLDIIDRHDAKENVVILRGDCAEMAKQLQDEELDLCFLDAGHSYEECKRDIELFYPKVKKGGILSGDDMDITSSFHHYLTRVGTFTEEEISKDAVEGKGHPGVLQAVYDYFATDVAPYDGGWYTFKGYRMVRGVFGLVPDDKSELLDITDPSKQTVDMWSAFQNNIKVLEGGFVVEFNNLCASINPPKGFEQESD